MVKEKWKNGKKFSPATIIFHSAIRGIIINHLKTHSSRTVSFFPSPDKQTANYHYLSTYLRMDSTYYFAYG